MESVLTLFVTVLHNLSESIDQVRQLPTTWISHFHYLNTYFLRYSVKPKAEQVLQNLTVECSGFEPDKGELPLLLFPSEITPSGYAGSGLMAPLLPE